MNSYYIHEENYAAEMKETVEPYLAARMRDFSYSGKDGAKIYAARYDADEPKGSIVLAHGFTESVEKYREMIYYFLNAGYSVAACDFRGHGRSAREVEHPRLTHIGKFETYVSDFSILCDKVEEQMPHPIFLFSHSMGGAVSSLLMEQRPSFFRAAVLSSPMIAPARYGLPYWVANLVTGLPRCLGLGKQMPGKISDHFDDGGYAAACGTSEARYRYYSDLRRADERFHTIHPTFSWTNEALHVTKKVLKKGEPEKIAAPVLLFSADGEEVVLVKEQKDFIARVPGGELCEVKDSKHEVYMSHDDVLFPYLEKILAFYEENLAK